MSHRASQWAQWTSLENAQPRCGGRDNEEPEAGPNEGESEPTNFPFAVLKRQVLQETGATANNRSDSLGWEGTLSDRLCTHFHLSSPPGLPAHQLASPQVSLCRGGGGAGGDYGLWGAVTRASFIADQTRTEVI